MSATDLYFIRFAGRDTSTVGSISARALSQSPRYWVQQARARYNEWLSVAPVPPVLSNNPDAMTLYTSSLLILKNGLMPKIGTIVASFHPGTCSGSRCRCWTHFCFNYQRTATRPGVAMGCSPLWYSTLLVIKMMRNNTLRGWHSKFHWRANVTRFDTCHNRAQLRDDGGFHTCYDWFTGGPVGFVEPQFGRKIL